MPEPEKLLIICYTFPPAPGIGGRRWAKFSKYLAKTGYEVHVISAKNIWNEISLWNADVADNKNIKVHFKQFTFQSLICNPRNIFEKTIRRIIVYLLKTTKYSEAFITSFPNRKLWMEIEEHIAREKIKTVIVSGDPFLFYYASKLKESIVFKLILDYRDLWSDHSFYSTYVNLTKKQWGYLEASENYAINNCDRVVTVDDDLKKTLSKRLVDRTKNIFSVIHNGFDEDEFQNRVRKEYQYSGSIKLFFGGNISFDKEKALLHFADKFNSLKEIAPEIYSRTEISFFGNMSKKLFEKLSDYNLENFHIFHKLLPTHQYIEQLSASDAGMLLVSKDYPNSFYTKFTDYLYLNKYMVAIGYEGELSAFLERNNCGCIFTLQSDENFFITLHENIKIFSKIPPEIVDQFNLKHLTEKYVSLIRA